MPNSGFSAITDNIWVLMDGLLVTLKIALFSIFYSLLGGMVFGILRMVKHTAVRTITRLYIEMFRIIPIMVWLIMVFFTIPMATGLDLSGSFTAIFVFSLWGTAEMGEIVRGAFESLPKHQWESARAIGMKESQIFRYILIPQAFRRMTPGTINLATRIIKTTSLVVLIGAVELIKRGQQVIDRTHASLWIYGFIALLYFLMCFPLSFLSKKLETTWEK